VSRPLIAPAECRFAENMALFASLLRANGLPVGTAELLDALQALSFIDIGDRRAFKTALRSTLVKNHRDLEVFDELFDCCFVPPEVHTQRLKEAERQREQQQARLECAAHELSFKGEPLQLSPEEMLIYTSLPERERESLHRFVRETEAAEKEMRPLRPLLETVVKGQLRYWHSRMAQASAGDAAAGAGAGGGTGRAAERERRLREADIQQLGQEDLPAAKALINRLSRQLAARLLQRRQRRAPRGALDFRRTVRANMRHGGRPFLLKYKRKRPAKLQLLFIGDLSASMKRYSSFVLQFIYGLKVAVSNLEIFAFADTLEYLTPALKQQAGLEELLERVVLHGKSWGGGTNIGAALAELNRDYRELLTTRTVAIIVSDTRTINLEAALPELRRLKERVRRLIWLNPLPPEQWPRYRSVAAFGEIAEMWPCNTIARLEEAIAGRLFAASLYLDGEAVMR